MDGMGTFAFKYRGDVIIKKKDDCLVHRDIDSLLHNQIFASRIKELNDPYEKEYSVFSVVMSNAAKSFIEMTGENVSYDNNEDLRIESIGQYCRIYSLALSQNSDFPDNELMWAHYANSHKGFCIAYDWNEMCSFFTHKKNVTAINVNYLINPPSLFEGSTEERLIKVLGSKSKMWEYENESRLIFSDVFDCILSGGLMDYPVQLVKAVYLGVRISAESKKILVKYGNDNNIPVYQMFHPKNSYKLEAILL